ncbi:hypothetical protein [Pseudomonas chlororaphis]|uniref:hypothetical protein n=1 Tax=Pseudomonas chlororaphis TaxID=587753 RepID=UPI001F150617|nr:hypothetical protein [Pseudomonas chlororaphis]
MTRTEICNLVPLTRNDTDHPVLYLDANTSLSDLYTCAQQRIGAARNLLEILDCAFRHSRCCPDPFCHRPAA